MNKTDLENALDRLENVLNAEKIRPHVRREIDIFTSHLAAELVEAWSRHDPEKSELFESLSIPSAN